MANLQTVPIEQVFPDQFPVGVRVLVVDDDIAVLKDIEQMCNRCHYQVTTCSEARVALNLLWERSGCFDVILSDDHMPDIHEFLQHVHKMNIPFVVMSDNYATNALMESLKLGACNHWTKPLRYEQIKNIWQHAIRKSLNKDEQQEKFGNLEDEGSKKRRKDDSEFSSSDVNNATEGVINAPNESDLKEVDVFDDYPPSLKKPRVVWTPELHEEFVRAVMQIGLDKAVPKKILEGMNAPNLTRANIASHLQKYRNYLKKLETQQQNGMPKAIPGTIESQLSASGGFDFQAFSTAEHVPQETLAGFHPELIRCQNNLMPREDQTALQKPSIQWPNHPHAEQYAMAYGHPLANYPSNIAMNFPQSNITLHDASSRYGAWPPSNTIASVVVNNSTGNLGLQRNNVLMMNTLQQQSLMHHQIHPVNVQTSCLGVSRTLEEGNSHASVNHNCRFGRNYLGDYSILPPQSNNPFGVAQLPGENTKARDIFLGCNPPASTSPPPTFSSSMTQQLQNSTLAIGALRSSPGLSLACETQVPYGSKSGDSHYQAYIDDDKTKEEPNSINSPQEDHPVSQRYPS